MPKNQPTSAFNPIRFLQRFVVSAFVVFAFAAYAVHEHITNPDGASGAAPREPSAITQQLPDSLQPVPTAPAPSAPQAAPRPTATAAPPARSALAKPQAAPPTTAAIARGQYKDGTYTGPNVDAFYGFVQVRAVVRNGKIADVQFVKFPNDRRTSVRINAVAVPYLQSEAIQVQSANVDFISGATLTSEAFAESLQAALNTAKN
ncbi:MAG: FMN-binding protein [Chloroflexota bacterium]|nr:FMN-binding protein [Chloroflexota bacterium]